MAHERSDVATDLGAPDRTTPRVPAPGDPAEQAVATSGRRRRTAAVAILVAFVALVVALLALPGGKVVGDTTTNITTTTVLPELEPGEPLVQPFVATEDRLAAVYVTFGTYFGSAQCDLEISLHEREPGPEPGTGPQVAERDWACSDLADSGRLQVLEFAPLEDSQGETFDLVVERVDDGAGQGAVVWAGAPDGEALPVIVDGVEDETLSAAVRPEYDPQPHQWDHIGRTLERLAAYGPAWGSAGVFAGLVVLLGALVSLGPLALRSTRTLVVLVALLAVVRGLIWSAAVPALEGMDEPAHFAYVQHLAEEGEFPGHVENREIFSERLHGTIEALNVESTTPGDRPDYSPGGEERTLEEVEDLSPTGGGGGPGSMYAPFYYLPGVPLYEAGGDDILSQIALVRLWSVLLGAAAAVLLVLIGRRLFPASGAAQGAFAVAGVMQPMVAHQFAIVNNDGWVVTAGFAALLVGLELAARGRAPRLALLAGVVIGAALLGKPFAIACAVPLGVGWLVGKVRFRERSLRVLAGEAGLVVLGFLLTYGLWTLNAARLELNTSEVPEQRATGQTVRDFLLTNFGGGQQALRTVWANQLWGNFGWVRIPLPTAVQSVIFWGLVLLALGLAAWAVVALVTLLRGWRARAAGARPGAGDGPRTAAVPGGPLPVDVRLLMVTVTIVGIVATLYAAAWVYYASTGQHDLLQGRYALLAVPAFLAAPALLAERFGRGRLPAPAVMIAIAAGMVGLNLLGLLLVLEAFYG
ncbi:DUF2142 domain-containing protein [Actinotalea sp. JY-7885]|uniref:DUF2142 domain-containing protein n=1 Tax=Actinotalea sp. JY-7885 TaxID=2758576 RepID=UPI00165D7793|nr:DUF2142 domain-containing protein [Actinotalea sp. JY-7885]